MKSLQHIDTSRSLWLLLLALLPLYGMELAHGLPNRGVTWAVDGDPLIPLMFAKRGLLDGWNTGWHYSNYPDFHRFVLLTFHGPYMVGQYALGNLDGMEMDAGYPYGIKGFDGIYYGLGVITRAVSAVMALGMVYFIYRTGKVLFPERSAIWGAMLAAFAPAVVYYIHTEQHDVPMLFWLSAALYCYVRVLQTFELRFYVWLAILAAVSTSTKYYAYGAFVLMPLPLVWHLAKSQFGGSNPKSLLRATIDRRHLIATAVFVGAFILTENMLWNPSGFAQRIKLASGSADTSLTVTTQARFDAVSFERVKQFGRVFPFALGWVTLPVCLLGMVWVGIKRWETLVWLLCPIIGLYVFVVVPVLPAEASAPGGSIERPFIPIGMIMAICGGQLLASVATRGRIGFVTSCAVSVAALANAAAVDSMLASDPRYAVEAWFAKHVEEGTHVDVYGYPGLSPRIYTRWQRTLVNQDEQSDVRIVTSDELEKGLKQRAPKIVVVAAPYRRTWHHKQKHEELAPAFRGFFDALHSEELGYRNVAHFQPRWRKLFGIPEHRRIVPAMTIYQRNGAAAEKTSP